MLIEIILKLEKRLTFSFSTPPPPPISTCVNFPDPPPVLVDVITVTVLQTIGAKVCQDIIGILCL